MAHLEQTETKVATDNLGLQNNDLNLLSLLSDKTATPFKAQSDTKTTIPREPEQLIFSDLPAYNLSKTALSTTAKVNEPAAIERPVQSVSSSTGSDAAAGAAASSSAPDKILAQLAVDATALSAAEAILKTKDKPGSAQFIVDEKLMRKDAEAVVIDMGEAKDLYPSSGTYQKQWTTARNNLANMDSNLWNIENRPSDSAAYKQNLTQLFQNESGFQTDVTPLVNTGKKPAQPGQAGATDGLGDVVMSTPSAADITKEVKDGFSFGTVRLWDNGVKIDQLETNPNAWNTLKDLVDTSHDNKKQVMYTFGLSGQDKPVPSVASVTALTEKLAKWSAEQKVPPNKGGIDTYELWNEPNASGYWSGSPESLAKLNAAMITEIKKYDPTAKIASPAVSFDSPAKSVDNFETRYFGEMKTLGVLKDIQQVDFHGYQYKNQSAAQIVSDIADMQTIQKDFGLSKDALVDSEDSFGKDISMPNVQAQADDVAEKFIMEKAEGITPGYYGFGNNRWGSLTTDGTATGKLTETAQAWKEVNAWLDGAKISDLKQNGNIWTAEVTRNGKDEVIAWAAQGTAEYTPGADFSSYENLNGTTSKIRGAISLGEAPVLIT